MIAGSNYSEQIPHKAAAIIKQIQDPTGGNYGMTNAPFSS